MRDPIHEIGARLFFQEAQSACLKQRRINRRHDNARNEIMLDPRWAAPALKHKLMLDATQ